jgi:hypothetical protein
MDFSKLVPTLEGLAPWIAGSIGTPAAGVAVSALESVFGLDKGAATPATLAASIKGASSDQLLALKQADSTHAEFMAKLGADKLEKLADLQIAESNNEASQENGARDMATKTSIIPQCVVAAFVLIAWGLVQYFMITHIIDPTMKEIVARLLGTLDAAVILVLQFFFGPGAHQGRLQELLAASVPATSVSATTAS